MSTDAGRASTGSTGVLVERSAGSVSIPQEAFIAALRMGEEQAYMAWWRMIL
jgi:hypothetical protein